MKKVVAGVSALVLAAVFCIVNIPTIGFSFSASADTEKKGLFDVIGGWFSDRGEDISNAATVAVDATGKWFVERGEDVFEITGAVGGWVDDRANDVVYLATDAGELIVCAAANFDPSKLATKEYYLDSGEKLLLGDYSDKDPTALSIGLNLAASVVNLDLGMDIRDLVYDVQNYGSEDVTIPGLALDAVAVLPIIGVVKYVKYIDPVVDSVKIVADVTDATSDVAKSLDTAIDAADSVHDMTKTADVFDTVSDTTNAADAIDDVADTAKASDKVTDTAKAADLVDDAADAGREITKIPFEELPEKVQENYNMYADCGWDGEKALENMAEGTDAGRPFYNIEEDLPTVDDMGNELSYKEYDAYQKGDDPIINEKYPEGRGAGRLIRDNLGNVYFSENHYETFQLVA